MKSSQRRYHEIYHVVAEFRYRRGHTMEWTVGWIQRNYFVAESTIYKIISGVYGDLKSPVDPEQASSTFFAAMSPDYQKYATHSHLL